LGRNESHADIRARKCNIGWKALSRLSFRASVEVRLSIGTAACKAAGQRQNEGSRGALQRRNRPLSHVPVGAFNPKAVQWFNEEQVKMGAPGRSLPFEPAVKRVTTNVEHCADVAFLCPTFKGCHHFCT
jgi:hypothetical protein